MLPQKTVLLTAALLVVSLGAHAFTDTIPVSYAKAYLTEVGFAFYDDSEGVHLTWTNPYDEAVVGYDIERSADGDTWTKLTTKQSTGEVGKPTRYEYVDREPYAGLNLYRLIRVGTGDTHEITHEIAVIHAES